MDKISKSITLCLILNVGALAIFEESAYTHILQEGAKKVRLVCLRGTSVDIGLVENARHGHLVDDDNLKTYTRCGLTQMGLMDEHGDILYDVIREIIPENIRDGLLRVAKMCEDREGGIYNPLG